MNETDTRTEASTDPTAHVEAVVKASGSSFFWAMRVLPEEKRRAMYAVYAFCREVDDIADEPGNPDDKMVQLGQWRDEIERLYTGPAAQPVGQALIPVIERFGLRKEDFLDVIAGMEMDAQDTVRLRDMDELVLYCDRVASAVGRLSVRIFGLPEDVGDRVAFSLGQALQLTNILRDVREDAERDRLYLPADQLRAHGINAADLDAVLAAPALAGVREMIGGIAHQRFDEAKALMATCDPDAIRPAVMMMDVYYQIYRKLVRRGWQDLSPGSGLNGLEKLRVLLRRGRL